MIESFDITVRDGRAVHIRAIRLEDEAELLQAFERLSAEARYMRFMRVVRDPNMKRLRALLASFPKDGIGLVATVPATDGIDIVGSAIAVFSADRTSCGSRDRRRRVRRRWPRDRPDDRTYR